MTGTTSSGSSSPRGAARRYTIEFHLGRTSDTARVRSVTSMGEPMGVALATARLLRKLPDASVSAVEVLDIEDDFTIDPAEDAVDYWNLA